MIKLSIVTITLNNKETIEQTIKSILDQKYPNLEYIVIDGGSTDGTLDILNKYKDNFKYFKSSPDKGIYDAMNKGIIQATGKYICFVNGGDFLYQETLKNVERVFSKNEKNLFFSVADIDYIDDNNNLVGSKICRTNEQIIKRRFVEMPTNHLGMFVPLSAFKKHGLFDLNFKHRADFYFVLKLIKNGYKPLNLNVKIGGFRLGGISGGYSTFLENYKIVKLISGNILTAFYSCSLGISKLFFQRNLPFLYSIIAKFYYKINKDVFKKEVIFSNNLKILHIIDSDLGGGAEKIVSVLQKNIKNNYKIITLKKLSEKNKNNPNYISIDFSSKNLFLFFISFFKFLRILININDKKNLLLHSHLSKSLYLTFFCSIFFRVNHIHTEHNTYNRRRSIPLLYPIEFIVYNSLKHIICISEPTRYELVSYLPSLKLKNTSVIENGSKIYKHRNRNYDKKKFNILVLGSLTKKKGIDLLIESLSSLSQKINKIKIVGSGPEKQNLINLTKKIHLDHLVEFIPFIEDPSIYIYQSDIGVIPSRWEGFGLVAVEMRSSGLPILISDTPGLYNTFSQYNGVYSFKNGSAHSLKESLILLLDHLKNNKLKVKDLNNELGYYSERFFIKRYANFYQNFITEKFDRF